MKKSIFTILSFHVRSAFSKRLYSSKEASLLVTYANMFHKLMHALGDGYRSLMAELEDALQPSEEYETSFEQEKHASLLPYDCSQDVEMLR